MLWRAAQVIAAPDIGLYGGLCALASYNRRELQDLVRGAAYLE